MYACIYNIQFRIEQDVRRGRRAREVQDSEEGMAEAEREENVRGEGGGEEDRYLAWLKKSLQEVGERGDGGGQVTRHLVPLLGNILKT
jgi:hypothetical protein